ncbi:MAG: single-stranded-DNA-specific exonuclease RecJ [Akkermansiaceae bacterium]
MQSTPFRWVQRSHVDSTAKPANQDATCASDFPDILRQLLAQRGIPEDGIEAFLHPKLANLSDPFLIPDMEPAVERILHAVDQNQHVCIYGDYDVDGITSITLMAKILTSYGLSPRTFIPKRGSEGYGLSIAALERCMNEGEKPDLLITVDCGTVSSQEVSHLKDMGIDVVIVDHHEPDPSHRPDCIALVNPKCGDQFTYLCAAGVVFKVGHALLKTRQTELDLRQLLDLVAVATISDIVPLIDENRLLVRHGLKRLPSTKNFGLKALQKMAGITEKVTSMDVGFRIGPRINAAGRMDDPGEALATLNADSEESAEALAESLDDYNRQRQTHEGLIRKEAVEQLSQNFDPEQDPVIVIGSRAWHHGVVGIVASRLMRQYYKPTFVVAIDADGIGKGSGRSIEGVSLVEAIRACDEHLIAGGGHDMAAGLSVHEDKLDSFRMSLAEFVLKNSTEEDRLPRLMYDAEITFASLSMDFLASYELLQPFGNSNPQPVFIARHVELSQPIFHMKNNHLRLLLKQGYHEQDAVFFGGGERDLPEPPWDIAFTINRNTFRGKTTLQIIIQDIIKADSP